MAELLCVKDLTKVYGKRGAVTRALDGVDLSLEAGEYVGIMGASGSGKTTLLNVLTGELDYEEGTVSLTNGKVIGYLHQNSGLSNGKTIQQEMEAVFADLLALENPIRVNIERLDDTTRKITIEGVTV